jgi:long-chain acyl-CoA synthetase
MAETIAKLLRERMQEDPEHGVQLVKDASGAFQGISWRRVYEESKALGAGLLSLGVKRGDHVGIISDNMKEWLWADLAIISIGAADVPRGSDSMAQEIRFILDHAECAVSLVENHSQLEKVLSVGKDLKKLKTLVVLDPDFSKVAPDYRKEMTKVFGAAILTFGDVQELGREYLRKNPTCFEDEIAKSTPEEIVTIIYTSGTTGEPKGVMLNNANYMHQIRAPHTPLEIRPSDIFLSALPVWHSYERAIEYVAIFAGCQLAYSKLIGQVLLEDMGKVRPTIFPSIPRIWEGVKKGIIRNIEHEGGAKKALAYFFIGVGTAHSRLKVMFRGLTPRFKARMRFFDALIAFLPLIILTPFNALGQLLVFKKIKQRLGGRFRFGVSGAGALPPHVDDFFAAAGVLLLEGYGLTESAPIVSVRDCRRPVPGTIGRPLPEDEVKVLDESGKELGPGQKGVLHVKGPNVMVGYYKRPDLTAQAISPDGWLNTGDLAMLTRDGEIKIVGRAKETVVLLGGENVEPVPIEDTISESDYVEQVMIVGQDQKFLAALVVPNFDALTQFAKQMGIPFEKPEDLLDNADVYKLYMNEIDSRVGPKRGFKLFERVNRLKLLPRPFEKGTEMTHTLKLRRDVIDEHFSREIGELFKERR